MTERDYTKFIREDGLLWIKRIPRPVYVEMVREYQHRPEIINAVFDELYWLWDLEQAEQKAKDAGNEVDRVSLAHELIEDMDDKDWWAVTAAFEEHLITSFAENPEQWATFLDPVYDLQESEGWRDRQ